MFVLVDVVLKLMYYLVQSSKVPNLFSYTLYTLLYSHSSVSRIINSYVQQVESQETFGTR